jgi:hypothetical protein
MWVPPTHVRLELNLWRQIPLIVEGESPLRVAIEVHGQCVAFGGLCSSVATTTCST